jgi:ComF family protein
LGAATSYDNEEIRKIIWRLKYRGRTGNAVCLAILLTDYLKNLGIKLKNYEVIPVPLSKKRERNRGYNQAQMIAKIVAANLGLPLSPIVSKIKDTPAQAEIKDWDKRKKNLENCFAIANPKLIKDKNFIILDDVFTSGATLNEIARVLKNAGAKRILGLVVAKAG